MFFALVSCDHHLRANLTFLGTVSSEKIPLARLCRSCSHSLSLSLSLSLTHIHTLSLTLSLSLCLASLSLTQAHTQTHFLFLSISKTLSLSRSHTHAHTVTHTIFHSLVNSLPPTEVRATILSLKKILLKSEVVVRRKRTQVAASVKTRLFTRHT